MKWTEGCTNFCAVKDKEWLANFTAFFKLMAIVKLQTTMQNCSIKIFAAGFALLLVAGCDRDNVKVYHVTGDQAQPQPQAQVQAAPAFPTNASDQTLPPGHPDVGGASMALPATATENVNSPLTWKTPDGWTEVPPSELRVASFKINQNGKMVDVSVIPLGGMAGTDSANVNRWRGQVGLTAAADDEIQKSVENVVAGGAPAQLYDVVGTNPASGDKTRIIAVIQHRDDGNTWFYKMTGDADLVEQQKPAFVEFLKSLNFSGATAQTETPTTLPPGHPQIGDMNSAAANSVPISQEGQPDWTVPSGWQEIPPAQFLLAEFSVTGANGAKADVNVAALAGDGGGLPANIDRWRGQLGLAPLSEEDFSKSVESIDVAGGKASLVDLSGTDMQTGAPTRLVGVIVPQSDRTWFYKLMGDTNVVAAQKDAFIKFIQSAK